MGPQPANETRRVSMPEKTASRTAVGGRYGGPVRIFPGIFGGMCFRDMTLFYGFFFKKNKCLFHKTRFCKLVMFHVLTPVLVWKDRSVDESTVLVCVFVFPWIVAWISVEEALGWTLHEFELEWLFKGWMIPEPGHPEKSTRHRKKKKKHQLTAQLMFI